ncbi:MAG TPA: UTP--glucose-1-phosphate uridylyltransferase, partial [Clostridiaceae bacterium]|nr:UTP--glucose-1-phosphate uridylyltransferase [Clostridiaceae bacterium]
VQEVPMEDVYKYGIVNGVFIEDDVYKVKDLVEKPSINAAPSNIAILGRYIISPQIFEMLEKTKPGKNGEVQLTDALKLLLGKEAIYAYKFKGKRYDVGDKLGFLQATVEFALKRDDIKDQFKAYLKSIIKKID